MTTRYLGSLSAGPKLLGLAVLIAHALSAAPALAAQQRLEPPAPLPAAPITFPEFSEHELANGARVIIVEDHKVPVVALSLFIRSGTAADPVGLVGAADFTARLLVQGTTTRSAREIAETIAFVGGSLGSSANVDWTSINMNVLTEYLDTALVVLSDLVLNPAFPPAELELLRQRSLGALQVELSQPAEIASRFFMRQIYGEHPYGAAATPESVRALSRDDLVAFHDAHYRPGNALLVVAGDVEASEIVARLDQAFGEWTGGGRDQPVVAELPTPTEREITLVHRPGSVQTVFRLGQTLPPAAYEDWTTLNVANQLLGGGTMGWLFRSLRTERGFAYDAASIAARRSGPGYLLATTEVRNEVADSALAEVLLALDRLREASVPAEDLRGVLDYLVGSFPLTIETPAQVAGQVARERLLGLPPEYVVGYRDRVAAVSAERLQEVVRGWVRPDRVAIVAVGDATQVLDKIRPFGAVRVVDASGKPLPETEFRGAATAPVTLDATLIPSQRLAYRISIQGNPLAEVERTIRREEVAGREVVHVVVNGKGMIISQGELAFDGHDFTALYSKISQQVGPRLSSAETVLQGGKIRGKVVGPDGEARDLELDAPPGTLLPEMDEFALWVTDLESRRELQLPVLNGETGTVQTVTYRVVGESRIEVPAGEFEVYEIEASGGALPLKIYLRKGAPHLMVRLEYSGQPIAMELVSIAPL